MPNSIPLIDDIQKLPQNIVDTVRERLRSIMEAIPQKIFTTSPDGHLDYFNPQWTAYTGVSTAEMQDSGWTRFVHADDLAQKTRLWRDAFDNGEDTDRQTSQQTGFDHHSVKPARFEQLRKIMATVQEGTK